MKIFDKIYSAEELYDLDRDVNEAFDSVYNPLVKDIPSEPRSSIIGIVIAESREVDLSTLAAEVEKAKAAFLSRTGIEGKLFVTPHVC